MGEQLEEEISTARFDHNEALSGKSRKHKSELRRLASEREAYEERANGMIAQMNEQMQLLQNAAMTRIESLERELMEERRAREDLQEKVHRENSARSATKRIMPDSERNGEVEDNDDGDDPCDSSTGTPKTPINMKASRGRSTRGSISSMSS